MANVYCTTRTNYFHVKDEEAFRALMSRVYGSEDGIDLWEEQDESGKKVFGFGCHGAISGLRCAREDDLEEEDDDDDVETSFDEFITELQKCVADDDAIIIMESGHEKLRYVYGDYTVITSKHVFCNNMTNAAIQTAREFLKNSAWKTKYDY